MKRIFIRHTGDGVSEMVFLALLSFSSWAFCPNYGENPDCFDFSLSLQSRIATEKRLTLEDLSGSSFNKKPWNISFPNLKKCRHCNLQEVSVRPAMQKFANTDLSYSNLKGFEAAFGNFEGATLVSADFRGAKLYSANFRNADLTNANFEGADLSLADLRNAKFESATFKNAVTIGTRWK